jgi:hypothetical protein
MRYLTAWLEDGYCSIIVANHRLIMIIRFVAQSYIHTWKGSFSTPCKQDSLDVKKYILQPNMARWPQRGAPGIFLPDRYRAGNLGNWSGSVPVPASLEPLGFKRIKKKWKIPKKVLKNTSSCNESKSVKIVQIFVHLVYFAGIRNWTKNEKEKNWPL